MFVFLLFASTAPTAAPTGKFSLTFYLRKQWSYLLVNENKLQSRNTVKIVAFILLDILFLFSHIAVLWLTIRECRTTGYYNSILTNKRRYRVMLCNVIGT